MPPDQSPREALGPLPGDDAVTLDSAAGSLGSDATRAASGLSPATGAFRHPSQLRPGDVFAGRYGIEAFVGRGGFSYVYRAWDQTTGTTVALKFLAAREAGRDLVERMRRELRLARDLRHPNIVRVFELHEVEEFYCLAMEYVAGRTLKEEILERSPLPLDEARALLLQLASAMAAVHAAGIVHRDLKPQNAVVTEKREVKLLDFGLARTPDSTGLTTTGTILGTPDYMAPEQVEGGKADSRSDVYSLGIIAYELLVGRPPFSGDSPLAVALQHVRARVQDPRVGRPEVPADLSRLVLALTEPDPARRPASAQELLVGLAGQGGRVTAPPRRGLRSGSGPVLRLAAAAALVVAVVAGGAAWWRARGRAISSSPLSDGKVTVAVVTPEQPGDPEHAAFLSALASTLEARLATPRVQVRRLDPEVAGSAIGQSPVFASLGVEELLRLKVTPSTRDSEPARLEALVAGTDRVEAWKPLARDQLRRLDLATVDQEARSVAAAYLARVDAAFGGAGEADATPPPTQ